MKNEIKRITKDVRDIINEPEKIIADFKDPNKLKTIFPYPLYFDLFIFAKELLKRYPKSWYERLEREAIKKINAPRIDIMSGISWLKREKFIIQGSKLTKEDVLFNQFRSKIYITIVNHPGIHFRGLLRKINGESKSALVRWHLNVLIKFGFIEKYKINMSLCFFPINFKQRPLILYYYLQQPLAGEIIKILLKNNSYIKNNIKKNINSLNKSEKSIKCLSLPDFCKILGEPDSKIRYQLNKLIKDNLIGTIPNSKPKKYFIKIKIEDLYLSL